MYKSAIDTREFRKSARATSLKVPGYICTHRAGHELDERLAGAIVARLCGADAGGLVTCAGVLYRAPDSLAVLVAARDVHVEAVGGVRAASIKCVGAAGRSGGITIRGHVESDEGRVSRRMGARRIKRAGSPFEGRVVDRVDHHAPRCVQSAVCALRLALP